MIPAQRVTKSKKSSAIQLLNSIASYFPDAKIELDFKDPWQLLVAVSLSAQTTDKQVNLVTPALFKRFKNIHSFAVATAAEVEPYIRSLGFFRNKAKNLVAAAQKLEKDFDGKVPHTREELVTIPGVGPKTAGVIVAAAFNEPAFPVDTHVARVSYRLGFTKQKDPNKIEAELKKLLPKEIWIKGHHALIWHGRRICIARKPRCSTCPVNQSCPRVGVTISA